MKKKGNSEKTTGTRWKTIGKHGITEQNHKKETNIHTYLMHT